MNNGLWMSAQVPGSRYKNPNPHPLLFHFSSHPPTLTRSCSAASHSPRSSKTSRICQHHLPPACNMLCTMVSWVDPFRVYSSYNRGQAISFPLLSKSHAHSTFMQMGIEMMVWVECHEKHQPKNRYEHLLALPGHVDCGWKMWAFQHFQPRAHAPLHLPCDGNHSATRRRCQG